LQKVLTMNTLAQKIKARRLVQLVHAARSAGARILAVLVLLQLLTACLAPGAAQQTVVKAVARAKPLDETVIPVPTNTPVPTDVPAPTATPVPTAVPAAAPVAAAAPEGQPVSLGTNGGEWQFDLAALEVAAGEEIGLIFHNGAKTTAHNWILVEGGDDVAAEINTAGAYAGEGAAYIADDPRIIARTTGLVKGGQSESVAFTAPAAGTYTYLCTFPGHFELGMKGVLTVK
jgi:azurin